MPELDGRRDITDDDVALLDALDVTPRGSFEQLSAALGISAVTAGRRWRRLVAAGQAWVSSAPGPHLELSWGVFVAECQPGRANEAVADLVAIPQVVSVHLITGTADLYALVAASDYQSLSRLLRERLPSAPGLLRTRADVITKWFKGTRWRLGAISPMQARAARGEPYAAIPAGTVAFDEFDRELFLALQEDGRCGYRELAARLGRSEHMIKRRISALVRHGMLGFRTDFARSEAGQPTAIALWLKVPDEGLASAGRQISELATTRLCAATIGTANLFVTVQLHDPRDLDAVLRGMIGALPAVEVVDRQLVSRPKKSWGRVLDADGCAITTVPVNPWAP